jgi:hypothetical protein
MREQWGRTLVLPSEDDLPFVPAYLRRHKQETENNKYSSDQKISHKVINTIA